MRIFYLAVKIAAFMLLLGFAAKNTDNVAVRYFLGFEWHAPLVFVLLVCFGVGIGMGAVASLAIIARQRREILGLKRELRRRGRALTSPAAGAA
jgi:uncharacterized integral membrane protein